MASTMTRYTLSDEAWTKIADDKTIILAQIVGGHGPVAIHVVASADAAPSDATLPEALACMELVPRVVPVYSRDTSTAVDVYARSFGGPAVIVVEVQ
jgi:hypothetical protein